MIKLTSLNRERCEMLADYLIQNEATVRDTARRFGISKSTVHKDITEKLASVNQSLSEEVKQVLEKNKAERHIRGGEATREKYKNIKKAKQKKASRKKKSNA